MAAASDPGDMSTFFDESELLIQDEPQGNLQGSQGSVGVSADSGLDTSRLDTSRSSLAPQRRAHKLRSGASFGRHGGSSGEDLSHAPRKSKNSMANTRTSRPGKTFVPWELIAYVDEEKVFRRVRRKDVLELDWDKLMYNVLTPLIRKAWLMCKLYTLSEDKKNSILTPVHIRPFARIERGAREEETRSNLERIQLTFNCMQYQYEVSAFAAALSSPLLGWGVGVLEVGSGLCFALHSKAVITPQVTDEAAWCLMWANYQEHIYKAHSYPNNLNGEEAVLLYCGENVEHITDTEEYVSVNCYPELQVHPLSLAIGTRSASTTRRCQGYSTGTRSRRAAASYCRGRTSTGFRNCCVTSPPPVQPVQPSQPQPTTAPPPMQLLCPPGA